ncbi:hypothetical protein [Streptomyces sp. BA2]|uniref:hypothetical protein n=1 Tax=Streptomyces sp. BA2 TaxID=436595 RepID=UPI001327E5CB|nr:hypothetical protein [Streptomyces sp. BA2]MWA10423.1 hypothetical protein [Streptomyces sp. BA2]
MAGVAGGDIVLFTGGNQVRAIGEIGAVFRSTAFADALWPPKAGGESWHTVYSLGAFELTDIPYAELSSLLGYSHAFQYPGQLVLDGERAAAVMDGFLITTEHAVHQSVIGPAASGLDEAERYAVRVAAAEESRASQTSYERRSGTQLVRRREGALVSAYRETLTGVDARRFFYPGVVCDLYINAKDGTGAEVIEAKSRTSRDYVRQALAQLLDYARFSPEPVERLSALFPAEPAFPEISLLHHYGIDCVYQVGPGAFERKPASDEARDRMRSFWVA